MKPVCVPCERFMRCKRNGYPFMEGMMDGTVSATKLRIGKSAHRWKPYKLWMGDLYECPDCHAQTIVGVAPRPLSEHYETKFGDLVKTYGATLLVKDC